MNAKGFLTRCGVSAAILAIAFSAGAYGEALRCEAVSDGVEYRAFLPDQNRYLYIAVKALPGYYPSVFVIVDKNYLQALGGPKDPVNQWWLDRTRPMLFSADTVKVTWQKSGSFIDVGGWFGGADTGVVSQPIRGLTKNASGFAGGGSGDINSYSFQTRLEMPGFKEDAFDVTLPAVTFDGVTITPPVVHFTRGDNGITTKC